MGRSKIPEERGGKRQMKEKVICTLILMLLAFAGDALAGTENANYTYYGVSAGGSSTSNYNTFIGVAAGANNTTGSRNTFIGHQAGSISTTGDRNTFLGNYT